MVNLFPGYELDIFSLRQKDFKGDRRAGEFNGDLKDRLGSKFTDGISICFAIYQQNGFLETHCLNTSLKEKLLCMVFIPMKKINSDNSANYETNNLAFISVFGQFPGCEKFSSATSVNRNCDRLHFRRTSAWCSCIN